MTQTQLDLARLMRPHLRAAEPYHPVPSLAALSAELGIPADQIAKLDANENPYGPSPRVLEALAAYRGYHLYPDPLHNDLRRAVADYLGTAPERVVLGAGADELIDLLCRLFLAAEDEAIDLVPTFGMYRFSIENAGAVYRPVARRPDFTVDVAAVRAAITPRTKLIWVAAPNNPTGTPLDRASAVALAELGVPLVIDEAYAEFSGTTLLDLTARYDHVFLLRTFSKWAGLAGLRVGYGVFPPVVAETLLRIKPPYNVNVAAAVAARAALDDADYRARTIGALLAERARVAATLAACPYLRPVESAANFIFCSVVGASARALRDALRRRGVLVRYYDTPLLANALRVSVGRPEDTDRLAAALATILPEEVAA
ncbi:MAG: histidinol-phosphate transaminase [Chloroflexota bacterium]|nr:histidinol-phosphate transaminase [Dehalococcoidia bacterium]MDW8253956.1 histidinol-phosphate transaminase [Chloroflexota bacterium]